MIKYQLICNNCNLVFDSWFASSKEFEKLKKRRLLNCHKCNSVQIEKSLMKPNVLNRSKVQKELPLKENNLSIKKTIKEICASDATFAAAVLSFNCAAAETASAGGVAASGVGV